MAVDGSIIIDTKLDTGGILRSKKDIEKTLASSSNNIKFVTNEIKAQQKAVDELRKELKAVEDEYRSLKEVGVPETGQMYNLTDFSADKIAPASAALEQATAKLQQMQAAERQLREEHDKLVAAKKRVDHATKKTARSFENASRRIMGLAKRVFFYSVALKAFHHILDYMRDVSATSQELTDAMARFRGSLVSAFTPLWNAVLPALITFVNFLTRAVLALAAFFSWLTGKSAGDSKALYDKAKAIKGVGAAADKSAQSLMAFDEINNVSKESGGGGGSDGTNASFDFDTEYLQKVSELMKSIGDYIVAIIAALATLAIARAFGAAFLMALGLALVVAGLYLAVTAFVDAWNNGLDWNNVLMILIGIALIVGGLAIAFGLTAAAIGLVIGGIALLVLGIKDWLENDKLNDTALTAIVVGLLLIGLAIALLTGLWIPLLIAAVLGGLIIIVQKFGDMEGTIEAFKELFQGLIDFFAGLFTGDMDRAMSGLEAIFHGLSTALLNILSAIQNAFNAFIDWIDEITDGKLTPILDGIKKTFNSVFDSVKTALSKMFDAVKQVLGGVLDFLTGVFTGNWEQAWEGLKNIVKGVINAIITVVEGGANFVIDGLNALINGFNALLELGDELAIKVFGTTLRIPSVPKMSLPRLAQGTVVPQNRQFAAILGDNKNEPEVVSPLSTMKQALLEAIQESGMGTGDIIVESKIILDGDQIYINQEKVRAGRGYPIGQNPSFGK